MISAPSLTNAQAEATGSACSESKSEAAKACGEAVVCIKRTTAVLCDKTREKFKENAQIAIDAKADLYRAEGVVAQMTRQAQKDIEEKNRLRRVVIEKDREIIEANDHWPWFVWLAIGIGSASVGAGALKILLD